ncbi:hypothetical protein TNCV_3650211 [Trichonephila clavipes]|nr:hypothetical protein TNCV_3650211 [Trichonephila clavipes]
MTRSMHTATIVRSCIYIVPLQKELHTPPPQSPDLNAIENLWSQLEKSVHEHAITSKEGLKNVLKVEVDQNHSGNPKN